MRKLRKLSIVIPFYMQSEKELERGVLKIEKAMTKYKVPFEIIVSHNGPRKKPLIKHVSVRIISDSKRGLGRAIQNGLQAAKGDYIYITSLESPFEFTDFIQMLTQYHNYALIIGSKLHPSSQYKIHATRLFMSKMISRLALTIIPSFPIRDPNGTLFGPTLLMRKLAKKVQSLDYFFCTELVYQYLKYNHTVLEVPVTYIKKDTTTTIRLKDGAAYIMQLLRLAGRERKHISRT